MVAAVAVAGGSPTTLLDLVRNEFDDPLLARVDLRFGMDRAGSLYVMTKQDGMLRRLVPQSAASVPALWSAGQLLLVLGIAAVLG